MTVMVVYFIGVVLSFLCGLGAGLTCSLDAEKNNQRKLYSRSEPE